MRCGCDHGNTSLSNLQTPQTMNNSNPAQRILGGDLVSNPRYLFEGHLFVAFVLEVRRCPSLGIVANDSLEDHDCSVLWPLQLVGQLVGINPLTRYRKHVFLARSPAHGRQKCDLVVLREDSFWRGELPVSSK